MYIVEEESQDDVWLLTNGCKMSGGVVGMSVEGTPQNGLDHIPVLISRTVDRSVPTDRGPDVARWYMAWVEADELSGQ